MVLVKMLLVIKCGLACMFFWSFLCSSICSFVPSFVCLCVCLVTNSKHAPHNWSTELSNVEFLWELTQNRRVTGAIFFNYRNLKQRQFGWKTVKISLKLDRDANETNGGTRGGERCDNARWAKISLLSTFVELLVWSCRALEKTCAT